MISLVCSCGKSYTFKEKFLGQKFRCSDCGTEMIVAEQKVEPSVPEPEMPTEFVVNPEKAAALKAPAPRPQNVAPPEAAPLTPDYGNVAAAPRPTAYPQAPVEEEYVLISNSAPELMREIAMQAPEDSGPPSEALSVILSRAAVAEHLMQLEDTLGVRATPVPVPASVQNKRHKRRPPAEPDLDPTQPEQPVMHHAVEKNSNQLVTILLIIIGILLLGILALLVFNRNGGEKEREASRTVGERLSPEYTEYTMPEKFGCEAASF